jgi:N-acetylglucosaminyldiphosphoundecaprenol N-acetyl-beta-D-mannosaminyltransferase
MATQLSVGGVFRCCGVRVHTLTLEAAVDRLRAFAEERNGRAVHLCNAWTLALAQRDSDFAAVLERADLNLIDGTPLAWVARAAGFRHVQGPVRGTDLLLATTVAGRAWGLRHYFYGSTPQVVSALAGRLTLHAPGIKIVGVESPPFRPLSDLEEVDLVDRVVQVRPDVVWVGLGTPQQDLFVDSFRDRLGANLVAVGAAFDFLAGAKRQAPSWVQGSGVEWAFRLATEPHRLWRRYLVGNCRFVHGVLKDVATSSGRSRLP